MFARLATTFAVGRRHAWRSGAIHDHRDEARRIVPARERPVLLCHWTVDPTSGRPVCGWEAEDAGAPPATNAGPTRRPVLTLAAANLDPKPHDGPKRAPAEARRPHRRSAALAISR